MTVEQVTIGAERSVLDVMRRSHSGNLLFIQRDFAAPAFLPGYDGLVPAEVVRSLMSSGRLVEFRVPGSDRPAPVVALTAVVTSVCDVRSIPKRYLTEDPTFVYVGRRVRGWAGSGWGNPYQVGRDARTALDAVRLFAASVTLPPLAAPPHESFLALRGKTLGCWCCNWCGYGPPARPCHAVVLARLADGLSPLPPEWEW